MPFAAAILRMVRDTPDAHVVLDLKMLTATAQDVLAATLAEYGIADRVKVISFFPEQLAAFRALNPGIATMHIKGDLPTVDEAASHGGVAVWAPLITPEWASEMHARGVLFSVRMANDADAWDAAGLYGADFAITDTAAAMQQHCA